MVENPNEQTNFTDISQEFTNMLVSSVLKRHGFKKENVKSMSDEERDYLKGLITNLKAQLENLTQPVTVSDETSKSSN